MTAKEPARDPGRLVMLGAATVLFGLVAAWQPGGPRAESTPVSPEALAALARFDPPVYTPPARKKKRDDGAGRAAMELYRARDYTAAAAALQAVVARDPRAADAQFFLSMAMLLQGRTAEGIDHLRRTIALGRTPFLEDAHFFLGKALLTSGRVADAERELQWTIVMKGARRSEAAAIARTLVEMGALRK